MKLKRIAALFMAVLMAAGFTGCIGNLYENALTVDGTDISSGLYLMAQVAAYGEAYGKVEDTAKSVLKQKVDGQSAKSWIQNRALELCKRYVAVHRMCREMEITLSSAGQQNVEYSIAYWEYDPDRAAYYTDNGISVNTYRRYITNQQLSGQLFTALYGEEGEMAVSAEELKAGYAEKYSHVRYLTVPVTPQAEDGNDYSEQVYAMLDQVVESIASGKLTLEQAAREELAPIYELLGRTFDADTVADGITTAYIPYETDDAFYPEELRAKLKGQATGDFGASPLGTSAVLYEVIPTFEDDTAFEDMRATVLSDLKSEAFEDYLRAIYDQYEVKWVPGAKWYFRPGKIVE